MATAQLDDKTNYRELTEKQKAVVDVKAEHKDLGPEDTAEKASEKLPGDETVSRSYVTPILNKYGDIIRKRRDKKDNERYQGQQKTVGDPFEGQLEDSQSWQTINDRTESENYLTIKVGQQDIEALLDDRVPKEIKDEITNELVKRAF